MNFTAIHSWWVKFLILNVHLLYTKLLFIFAAIETNTIHNCKFYLSFIPTVFPKKWMGPMWHIGNKGWETRRSYLNNLYAPQEFIVETVSVIHNVILQSLRLVILNFTWFMLMLFLPLKRSQKHTTFVSILSYLIFWH